MKGHYYLFWISWLLCFCFMFGLACCDSIRFTYPQNLICLIIFTVFQAITTTFAAVKFQIVVAVCAVSMLTLALAMIISLTLKPFRQLSFHLNFRSQTGFILLFSIISFIGLLSLTCMSFMSVTQSVAGSCIYLLVLTIDTEMVICGQKEITSPDQHILATLNMYLDFCFLIIHFFK